MYWFPENQFPNCAACDISAVDISWFWEWVTGAGNPDACDEGCGKLVGIDGKSV